MATMILLPSATGPSSVHWIPVGETYRHECLDDDNDDTSYVSCDNDTFSMLITYADPDDVTAANSGVAEADIASITSVRFLSSGKAIHRTDPSRVNIDYQVPSGNSTESCSYLAHRTNYTTVNGTARSHANGTSGGWTYANLESLIMNCTKDGAINVYLSYLALEVTYVEAAVRDNATFFGANF